MPNKILSSELRNYEVDILALAAQGVGAVQSVDFDNQTGVAAQIFINVTAISGGASLQVNIVGKDPVSGAYYTIVGSAQITTVGFTRLTIGPGLPATANISVNDFLPKSWAAKATVTVGGSVTATIAASINGGRN